tara:strand:+ start:413 stop:1528 length:1116 start_codon:yes stop_codon:yes gene_type:complete
MDIKKFDNSEFKGTVKETAMLAQSLRNEGTDVSFEEVVLKKHGISLESYYNNLGVNPSVDSISNIFTMDDTGDARWLVPEIYAAAMKLGLRRSPMWPSLIAAEQSISQTSIKMPQIEKADSDPRYVNEAETISKGTISFNEKEVSIKKIGRGIEIPYEVTNYVSLDVVSLFFEDMGNQLGLSLDVLAIDCILNGEQANGSESAPIVGVGSAGTKTYKDLLRVWVRLARLGRRPNNIIGGEAAALDTLDLAEFKTNNFGNAGATGVPTSNALEFKTPIPSKSNYWVHGNVPANQEIILDPTASLIKFNAQPLLVESEKVVSNQTNSFYATLTTGFAKLFTDGAVVIDKSLAFASNGFPAGMNVDSQENVIIK